MSGFKNKIFLALVGLWVLPAAALAHEVYVLPPQQLAAGYADTSTHLLAALRDPGNLNFSLAAGGAVLLALFLYFWFFHTRRGRLIDLELKSLDRLAPLVIRLAIAASLFFSAFTGSFLGPELSVSALPYGEAVRVLLYALSGMIFLGVYTEAAALAGIVLYTFAFAYFGAYMFTYLNYLGELVVLFLFGSRFLSGDFLLKGALARFKNFRQYENTIVRIGFGLALIYTTVSVKILHPALTLQVVNNYRLTQFYWLFPHDPLLLVLGAAAAELAIGLFILFGWETRLTVLVFLFYLTLSVVYFKEAVWPHFMLYGLAISLFLNDGGRLTLDNYFDKFFAHRRRPRAA